MNKSRRAASEGGLSRSLIISATEALFQCGATTLCSLQVRGSGGRGYRIPGRREKTGDDRTWPRFPANQSFSNVARSEEHENINGGTLGSECGL